MPKEVITTMKTYRESGTLQRGHEAASGDASIAMFGNTNQPVDVMVQTGHLFAPMPDVIRDDMAFIDRLHCYLPGWEIPKMRNEYFTDHYGFVVDYLAEALREILKLYDLRDSEETRGQIDGLLSVSGRRVVGAVRTEGPLAFCRGVEVSIRLDEDRFTGSGLFLFASVLERFLALYCTMNSFTKLIATVKGREGELRRWPPRMGENVLV